MIEGARRLKDAPKDLLALLFIVNSSANSLVIELLNMWDIAVQHNVTIAFKSELKIHVIIDSYYIAN